MRKLILISMLSFAALWMFSMVSADFCLDDWWWFYDCVVGQTCPDDAGMLWTCTCEWWSIWTWEFCWTFCPGDDYNYFDCDAWQYCADDPLNFLWTCTCEWSNILTWEVCDPSPLPPVVCDHAWITIPAWWQIDVYSTWVVADWGSCSDGPGDHWVVTCSDIGIKWWDVSYMYTGCEVLLPVSNPWDCDLSNYPGTMSSWDVLTWFSQNTASSCGIACPGYNTIACLDWVLSWWADYFEVQYVNCNIYSCGWGGWWGGGSSTPTCELEDLICVDGIYEEADWVNCRYGELWDECGIVEESGTWSNDYGDLYDFTRIWDISNSPYTAELNLAYLYAYNMWITSMDNILDANMKWNLIRSHMAKMLVERAANVKWLEVNTEITCDFDDIDSLQWQDLYDFVIEACQMWLMWIDSMWNPADNFNPDQLVTRAQFGTVLSRAIWGDYYNWASPYYVDHLSALNAVSIMNNISDPYMLELRWYVMLMLLRANQRVQ